MLTPYDQEHLVTYLRLLDADAEGADWREVARVVLQLDPGREPDRARQAFESHLRRAKWMTKHGYRQLLRSGGQQITLTKFSLAKRTDPPVRTYRRRR